MSYTVDRRTCPSCERDVSVSFDTCPFCHVPVEASIAEGEGPPAVPAPAEGGVSVFDPPAPLPAPDFAATPLGGDGPLDGGGEWVGRAVLIVLALVGGAIALSFLPETSDVQDTVTSEPLTTATAPVYGDGTPVSLEELAIGEC